MQVKKIFFSTILVFLIVFVKGQSVNTYNQLNNDSIRFSIWLVQPDWEKDIYYSETIIGIKSFDSSSRAAIKQLSKQDWLRLLNDEKHDWAANLALYELYRRYGGVFRVFDTREKWISSQKGKDIAYWKQKLK